MVLYLEFIDTFSLNMVVTSLFSSTTLLTTDEIRDFEAMYDQIWEDVVKDDKMKDIRETCEWVGNVMNYNVPHGKKIRGLTVPMTLKAMVKEPTKTEMKLAHILGWCIEILQAFCLIADDIMDGSETRRGRQCWYKVNNIGPIAFNDSLILEQIVFKIIAKYFKRQSYYSRIVDLIHDISYKTCFGQSLDTQTGRDLIMKDFTMDRYRAIVKYKTSYYTFYGPIALVMIMTGKDEDEKLMEKVERITLEIGEFFQIQDDYLDCYGDEKITGKVGTDIQDCKCTWLFVTAKQKCDPEQLALLMENYGWEDKRKVGIIKELYNDLDIPEEYKQYEEQSFEKIGKKVFEIAEDFSADVFFNLLDILYKRKT